MEEPNNASPVFLATQCVSQVIVDIEYKLRLSATARIVGASSCILRCHEGKKMGAAALCSFLERPSEECTKKLSYQR
jgi:hypothetical protein